MLPSTELAQKYTVGASQAGSETPIKLMLLPARHHYMHLTSCLQHDYCYSVRYPAEEDPSTSFRRPAVSWPDMIAIWNLKLKQDAHNAGAYARSL
jgi:hypothetical protein